MKRNLRHLRVFREVVRHASITRAAALSNLSQSAVTQAMAKLERLAGLPLFHHSMQGLFPTEAGLMLANRVERALSRLDKAFSRVSTRLMLTATTSKLEVLVAMREALSFTLAARRLGIAQPTVHRAITQLELDAGKPLFERHANGLRATRACHGLADAVQLVLAELDQAIMELGELVGRETGKIVVGSMPLARSYVLPQAIAAFRTTRPKMLIRIDEGAYDDLLNRLRSGEIDFLIGALRAKLPVADVARTELFYDDLVLVVGRTHPLAGRDGLELADLARFPWIIARPGAPTRILFDTLFDDGAKPESLVETGSLILMRQLLRQSEHIGCVSRLQAAAEIDHGLIVPLRFALYGSSRPIGLTTRADWQPTQAQRAFLDKVRAVAANSGGVPATRG